MSIISNRAANCRSVSRIPNDRNSCRRKDTGFRAHAKSRWAASWPVLSPLSLVPSAVCVRGGGYCSGDTFHIARTAKQRTQGGFAYVSLRKHVHVIDGMVPEPVEP